jgi:predicted ATP-grasp superfamily ATP-dependent carboligase
VYYQIRSEQPLPEPAIIDRQVAIVMNSLLIVDVIEGGEVSLTIVAGEVVRYIFQLDVLPLVERTIYVSGEKLYFVGGAAPAVD